eukprot:SAG22_NODE_21981_length_252_cov_1.000000_1_plen_70_part_10
MVVEHNNSVQHDGDRGGAAAGLTVAPGASTGVRSNAHSCFTGRPALSSDGSCASFSTFAKTSTTSAAATV